MKACTRKSLAATVTLLLFIQGAVAQSVPESWSTVQALAPGADISVKTFHGTNLQGKVDHVSEDGLVIWSSERAFPGRVIVRREVPRDDVKEIRMNRRLFSTAVGAAAGAGVGIAIGAAIDAQSRSNEDRGLASATLGLLGAAIGAAIGHTLPFVRGKRIYETQRGGRAQGERCQR